MLPDTVQSFSSGTKYICLTNPVPYLEEEEEECLHCQIFPSNLLYPVHLFQAQIQESKHRSNSAIQHYVMKFVSDLRQVGDFFSGYSSFLHQ